MATKNLNKWLKAWKGRNYKEMLKHSQTSWVNQNYYEKGKKIDIRLYLKNLYKHTELLEFEVLDRVRVKQNGEDLDCSVIIDYRVKCKVFYKNVPICKNEVRLIRMVHEKENGKPTAVVGEWGVNPMSALRKEKPVENDTFKDVKKGKTDVSDL